MNAFIDIGWAEQVLELISHTARLIPDGEAFVKKWEGKFTTTNTEGTGISTEGDIASLPAILLDLIKYSTVYYAGEAADVESVLNSIARLVCSVFEKQEELVKALCESLTSEANPGNEATRTRIVGNLFNNLDPASPSRYDAYMALIVLVGRNGTLGTVEASFSKLDTWVTDWQISTAQIRELYRLLHSVSEAAPGYARLSCSFLSKLLKTYDAENADLLAAEAATITPLAAKLVGMTLADPEVFGVGDVLRLKPVQANKDTKWFELLSLFEAGNIGKYRAWVADNGDVLSSLHLNPDDLLQKIRLQSFCYLCAKSPTVTFSAISQALEVDEEDVELWTIDAIKAGLIEARIDQARERVLVSRSRTSNFVESDWGELQERLKSWKQNLGQCQLVMNRVKMQVEESARAGAQAAKSGR